MKSRFLVIVLAICSRSLLPGQSGWTVQNAGITTLIRSIKSLDRNIGWITADESVIRRTTNGGMTWDTIPSPTQVPWTIAALNDSIAMVSHYGSSAIIYRTTDGGVSWTSVFEQQGGFIDALLMVDQHIGFALGDPVNGQWTVLTTTDAGVTWQHCANEPPQIGVEYGWTQSFCTIGTRHFWFGSDEAKIYRSTDGGESWSYTVTSSALCSAVSFTDSMNGVAGFYDGTVAYSSDGGVTWNDATPPGSGSIWGITNDGIRSFWLPRGDTAFVSTDRGRTWQSEFAGPWGGYLRDINFSRDGSVLSGWVGSSEGGVARYEGVVTSLHTPGSSSFFSLDQNYPNPFNPTTTIAYDLPVDGHVALTVYDVLGKEVLILVNEHQKAGHHVTTLDASRLSSGIYFYRIQAGEFSQTRKVVLVR